MLEAGQSSQSLGLCLYRMGRIPTIPLKEGQSIHTHTPAPSWSLKKSNPVLLTYNHGNLMHPGKPSPCFLSTSASSEVNTFRGLGVTFDATPTDPP